MRHNDSLTVGAVSGIIATIPILIINYITFRAGLSAVLFAEAGASIFVAPNDVALPMSLFIGYITNFVVGMILGVGIITLYRITGYDYYYMKALATGFVIWLLIWGLAQNTHIIRIAVTTPVSQFVSLILRLIFTLTTAWTIKYLQEKNILKA